MGRNNFSIPLDESYPDPSGLNPRMSRIEYFLPGEAPPFECPSGVPGVTNLEHCLIRFRDANSLRGKDPVRSVCFRCKIGKTNREGFSGRRYTEEPLGGED